MFQFQPPLPNKPPQKLSKFAAAAGKKMRKLRRNWSLKKSDISRSLSRIRRTSFAGSGISISGNGDLVGLPGGGGGGRRAGGRKSKAARSRDGTLVHSVHRGPSFKASSVVQSDESTLFYITLNIEDVEGDGDTGGGGGGSGGVAHVDEGSCELKVVCSGDNDDRRHVTQLIFPGISGSSFSSSSSSATSPLFKSPSSTPQSSSANSSVIIRPPPRTRRNQQKVNCESKNANGAAAAALKSKNTNYSVIRPTAAPPSPPPPKLPTR